MVTTSRFPNGVRVCTLLALFAWHVDARAQAGPVPPCGVETMPAYPALGAASFEQSWQPGDTGKDWAPPACTGWTKPGFALLVTTAARFHFDGGADSLLARIGAISTLAGLLYWSPTHGKWQPLILQANALTAANGRTPRADFTADEIMHGGTVYFQQSDNLLGKATYKLHVLEATPDRIVFSVENVGAMRMLLFTLVDPGEMQSIHFLDRESPGVWRYYGLVRNGAHTNRLVTAHPSSSINRAVAFFRHYAGIQADLEPPGAPNK